MKGQYSHFKMKYIQGLIELIIIDIHDNYPVKIANDNFLNEQ